MPSLLLPCSDRTLSRHTLSRRAPFAPLVRNWNRVVFAAAHVVADPLAGVDPWLTPAIDWDKTIAYREHLWRLGFGVAEAMDTAQRGMGLDWTNSLELIRRSLSAARAFGGNPHGGIPRVASGAGTDHLAPAQTEALLTLSLRMKCKLTRSRRWAVASSSWLAVP